MPEEQASGLVKDFVGLLTPQARRRLERDPDTTVLIRRALEDGWLPTALAEHVSHGIGYYQPSNARELMIFRLKKAAGDEVENG